jgi:hypothetical protein
MRYGSLRDAKEDDLHRTVLEELRLDSRQHPRRTFAVTLEHHIKSQRGVAAG